MSSTFDVKHAVVQLSGSADSWALRAPTDALGGGISVTEAYVINGATTSGTATVTVALTKYSSAGTPALNGTIAAAVGGTASHFTANVHKAMTISSPFVDAGEWVRVEVTSVDAGTVTAPASCHISYVLGR
jgi:hypothetical protein